MSLRSKRANDKWVAELEEDNRASIGVVRRKARIWPASKVAGASSRRDPLADEQIFRAISASLRVGNSTVLGRGRRPLVPKERGQIYVIKPDKIDVDGVVTRTIWTPDWTHTGDRLKLLAMGAAMEGGPIAMTVRLGPVEIEAALRSSRGFVGYFTERMGRFFKAAGDSDPQYAFMIETSPVHDLHIHGIITSTVPNLREVLAKVGGKTDMRARERQVHTKPIYDLVGWARYIAKAPFTTAHELWYSWLKRGVDRRNDGLVGASRATRARGREWYAGCRKSGESIASNLSI